MPALLVLPRRRPRIRRAGVAYLLAMMFIVLFAVLALGFYASSTTAVEVERNEVRATRARLAAESGTAFIRYHMGNVTLPAGTASGAIMTSVGTQLGTRLNGSANIGGGTIGASTTAVNIPANGAQYIGINSTTGDGFRADLSLVGTDVLVTVLGRAGSTTSAGRGVQLRYRPSPVNASIFGYGLATKGSLKLGGGGIFGSPASLGTFMAGSTSVTQPLSMSGGATITGAVAFVNGSGTVKGAGSIGGTTDPASWPLTKGVTLPEFPTVDTSAYVSYLVGKETVVTASPPSGSTLSNIRIRANTNVQFGGGCTLKGVILIETPNKITFSGGPHIQGVIVVDNPSNNNAMNEIIISGGGLLEGPETLGSEYGELRNMTGASILAPNHILTFTGGSASIGGTIIGKSLLLSGGGNGTVKGSVILTSDVESTFSGGSSITVTSTGAGAIPTTGVSFTGQLAPVATSYTEIAQ